MCDDVDAARPDRRMVLGAAAAAGLALTSGGARAQSVRSETLPQIRQPANPGPRAFMARAEAMKALALRQGDQGFGAVIVKDGKIVGEGPSRVNTRPDPTAHAEIEAIRDAARRLGTRDLSGCTMYGTFQACPMCETAAYWARIAKLVYGRGLTDAGRPRYGGR